MFCDFNVSVANRIQLYICIFTANTINKSSEWNKRGTKCLIALKLNGPIIVYMHHVTFNQHVCVEVSDRTSCVVSDT